MSIYDYSVKNRNGEDVSISQFKGKVLLIVNTATGCGFTPQYEGLEKLYKNYHEQGLNIHTYNRRFRIYRKIKR